MIREATTADEPALADLQRLLPEYDPALLPYAIRGPPLVLVAGDGKGYLIATLDEEDGGTAYIAELVVAEDHRREGVGTALLESLHGRAAIAGCDAVDLVVHPDNEAARAFYETAEYERVGTRTDFYRDADGIGMRRALD